MANVPKKSFGRVRPISSARIFSGGPFEIFRVKPLLEGFWPQTICGLA